MKLRNSKIVSKAVHTVTLKEFRKRLFRFLKEFGMFRAYIDAMTYDHIVTFMPRSEKTEEDFTLNRHIYRVGTAGSRLLFPYPYDGGENEWTEYYHLWLEWAYENYNIGYNTIII